MMTFLAPPSRCTRALWASVKMPVDSSTTSAPSSFHGSALGSRSASALNDVPSTVISSPEYPTSPSSRPRIESYFRRWARVLLSVRSLTPTTWMSAPATLAARKKLRPILPKPLMPTRTVTDVSSQRTGRTRRKGLIVTTARTEPTRGRFGPGVQTALTCMSGQHPGLTDHSGKPLMMKRKTPQSRRPRIPPSKKLGRITVMTETHSAHRDARIARSGVQHVRGEIGVGAGDAEVRGPLVGHRQQPADPARHRVLGHL